MSSSAGFAISPYTTRPGAVRKLLPGRGLAVDTLVDLVANQADLSVPATICTPAVDREDESINPDGVEFTEYARNPVVLWEHGFCPEIPLPIARSTDGNGVLSVRKSPGLIDATAYFSERDKTSYQIFGLIADKIIRATSIHVIPTPGTVQKRFVGGRTVTVYPQSSLLEWSFGCLGVNPESVAKTMHHGKIGGDAITEALRKTLIPWMPRARGNGVGADFGGVTKCAGPCSGPEKCTACSKKEDDMSVAKAMPMSPEEEEKKGTVAKAPAAPYADDAEAPPEEIPLEDEGGEGEDTETPLDDDGMKPSARVLGAVHESLLSLVANIEGAANEYENPAAVEYLQAFVAELKEKATEVEGLIGEVSGTADMDLAEVEPADEEVVKTWLATAPARGSRLQLAGLAGQMERLAKGAQMRPAERQQAFTLAKSVRAIAAKAEENARNMARYTDTRREAELQAQINALTAQFQATQDLIQSVLPQA